MLQLAESRCSFAVRRLSYFICHLLDSTNAQPGVIGAALVLAYCKLDLRFQVNAAFPRPASCAAGDVVQVVLRPGSRFIHDR